MTRAGASRLISAAALLLGLWLGLIPVQAAGNSDNYVEYIELQPPFITNYGGAGPLKYLKAEVSIKVRSKQAEETVKLHRPKIRNSLVMLLSAQDDDSLNTAAGREKLRRQALENVRQILVEERGQAGYEMAADLLFTSFVVQN